MNFVKNFKKGFTLIELLVVIAIIAILAAVVIAALNNARSKGGDAGVKSNLFGILASSELFYSNAGNYGTSSFNGGIAGPCSVPASNTIFGVSSISGAITAAGNAYNGGGIGAGRCMQSVAGGAWAVAVPLKSGNQAAGAPSPDVWCVDSTGRSKGFDGTLSASIASNACQ